MMNKVAFTQEDDALLMKYIATYNPHPKGRLGKKLYEKLVENAERKWTFSSNHTIQSWRERYKNNQTRFDTQIVKYQTKHGISADPFDNHSAHASVRSSVRKTLPARPGPPTDDRSSSTAPVNESGTKKRRREVGPEDRSLDSVIVKKIRREEASARGSPPCDPPLHTTTPPKGLRTRGEDRTEFPPSLGTVDNDAAPAIGSDDYTGALSGSGESDREGCLSEGKGASTSARLSRPSSPADKVEMKLSVAPRKSPNPSSVDATAAPEKPSLSLQHRNRHPGAVVAEVSRFLSNSVAPLQPSQEPTPPLTSAICSPRSPPPHQLSSTNGALTQNGVGPWHVPSASQRRRRNVSSPRKRIIAPGEEDDIFSTPPPQTAKENPPPRARARGPPRLVEGPFRSAYTNANGEPRLMLHGRRANGMEERVADGENEDWPPRRERRKSPIFSDGPTKQNTTPSQENKQPTVGAQQRHLSSTPYALDPVPADVLRAMALATDLPIHARDSTLPAGQTKTVPLQAAQVVGSAIAQTSIGAHRPLQPKDTPSLSQDQMLPNSEQRPSSHEFVQAKRQALATDRNRLLFPAVSAHDLPPPVPGPPSKRASLDQYPNPAAYSGAPVGDPFTVPPVKHKVRRQTLAGEREILRADSIREKLIRRASVQHIDLRALHSSKSVGTSVTGSATSLGRSSDVVKRKRPRRPPRSSTPPNLTESNKELVLALGLEEVYLRMAENHRFHIELVREVAARQRSLQDADRVLRNMREAAGQEFARLLRQGEATYSAVQSEAEESEVQDEGPAETSGDEEDDGHPVRQVQARPKPDISPTSFIPQRRERPLALKITTESPESPPMRPPDYSPPTPTRAHEFRRLERQGRVGEARLREARRVRRSFRLNSTDASPEVDEQRVVAYLLQLQEDNRDGDLPEKHRDINESQCLKGYIKDEMQDEGGVGPSISPGSEEHVGADTAQLQGNGFAEEQADACGVTAADERPTSHEDLFNGSLDCEHAAQAPSSPAPSAIAAPPSLDAEWTNSDDELLLDGDMIVHEELVRRKGLSSVKFRTAHLYGLLLGD